MTTSSKSPFQDRERPLKIFFYIDSGAMVSHCVSAAELIRGQLEVEIIFMMVDPENYLDETVKKYRVYDYASLFKHGHNFPTVWPFKGGKKSNSVHRWLSLLAKGYINSAVRAIEVESKIVKLLLLPWLITFMMAFRIARLARRMGLRAGARLLRDGLRRVRNAKPTGGRQVLLDALRKMRAGQLFEVLRMLQASRAVDKFLKAVEPDLIMLAEDNVETLSTIFVAKGRRLNIPSMVIPFTIPNPLEPALYYFDNPRYQARGAFARWLVYYYPQWRFHHEGRDLLRQPAMKALCQEALGLSSPAPWILNRGWSVSIAIDSDAQRDLYVKLGFPVEQLKVIGDMNGAMFSRVRSDRRRLVEEICSRYGWEADRPLILCGFPPDQYGGMDKSRFEFPDYDALIEAWMESFRRLGTRANILIRPHPRISIDRLTSFGSANIEVTRQPTAELIPLCDLYIASISATIRWAIACGIPVINYDTYRYRYADYKSAPGVVDAEDVEKFQSLMTRFVDDEKFAADLWQRQRSVMNYWGQLDDGTGRRLSALVLEAVVGAGRVTRNEEKQWGLKPAQ